MQIEVEEQSMFADWLLCDMATCDRCYELREKIERSTREKYNRIVERETSQEQRQYKQPHND